MPILAFNYIYDDCYPTHVLLDPKLTSAAKKNKKKAEARKRKALAASGGASNSSSLSTDLTPHEMIDILKKQLENAKLEKVLCFCYVMMLK